MSAQDRVSGISEAVRGVEAALATLRERGAGIPAVEKNCVRMLGTLRQLETQFCALAAALENDGNDNPSQGG